MHCYSAHFLQDMPFHCHHSNTFPLIYYAISNGTKLKDTCCKDRHYPGGLTYSNPGVTGGFDLVVSILSSLLFRRLHPFRG